MSSTLGAAPGVFGTKGVDSPSGEESVLCQVMPQKVTPNIRKPHIHPPTTHFKAIHPAEGMGPDPVALTNSRCGFKAHCSVYITVCIIVLVHYSIIIII